MKRGTRHHSKTERLMDALSIGRGVATGILESLWHITAAEAPHGDIGKLSDKTIGRMIDVGIDGERLVAALIESGWLDPSPDHRLVVHDWHDHADDATKKRVQRDGDWWAADGGGKCRQTADKKRLPEPEPEPEPMPEPQPCAAAAGVATLLRSAGFPLDDAKRLATESGATVERVTWLVGRKFPPGTRTQSIAKGIRDSWPIPDEPKPETPKERAARLVAEMAAEKAR